MTCEEAEVLLHALIDNELDAGHARDVETHVATCARCAAQLREYRAMHKVLAATDLTFAAPAELRQRVEAKLPAPPMVQASRRSLLRGFALGTAVSAMAASAVVFAVIRTDRDSRIASDLISAHLRSLQADHLTDVLSTDQHTVKPWFNGRLAVSPPVVDLTAQGFTLVGGRLDYIDGKPVAVIVYRRRVHVINLFVSQDLGVKAIGAATETVQGFNIRQWKAHGFSLLAVSDLNADELDEFGQKLDAAMQAGT